MVKVEAEFDRVAANYQQQHEQSIRLSGEDTGYFARYKIAVMHDIISSSGKKFPTLPTLVPESETLYLICGLFSPMVL